MDSNILTLSQAAEYLGVNKQTLGRMAQARRIPGRKIGREWRFLKEALDAHLREPEKPARLAPVRRKAG